ncbi:MAG: 3-oxoacyl-[acyl-carrier-protein] reductase [Chitinophagales bacterium]
MALLKGKTALITGASRGIGYHIAKCFAAEGADIAFTYLNSVEKAKALENELSQSGIKARAFRSDAASFNESEQLLNEVLSEFETIDILVNNAGITKDNLILRMNEQDWDAVLNANLKSVFNLTKVCSRNFLKQRKGSIINISSVVGISGNAGQSNYAASKAGIIGFSKSIADELGARNIRCNVIAPGFIQTEMTGELDENTKAQFLKNIPLNRAGSGAEVANTALFLASDLSSYVNGQVISVCGGLSR